MTPSSHLETPQELPRYRYFIYASIVLLLGLQFSAIIYLLFGRGFIQPCDIPALSETTNGFREINQAVPHGEVSSLINTTVLLDIVNRENQRVRVSKGIRPAGTRLGIHIHRYGGYTLILKGTMTYYVEGIGIKQYRPLSGNYMPPCTPMSASNLGNEDVELLDIFIGPPGQPYIEVLEPDWRGVREERFN